MITEMLSHSYASINGTSETKGVEIDNVRELKCGKCRSFVRTRFKPTSQAHTEYSKRRLLNVCLKYALGRQTERLEVGST